MYRLKCANRDGQKSTKPRCLCDFIALGVIIPHSSILLTIPVAFIYKSPLITFCREGIYALRNNGTDKSVPYTKFSNCDVIICSSWEFILFEFTFEIKYDIIRYRR